MKHLIWILFISNLCLAKGQDTLLIYLDNNFEKTSKEKASYYRKMYKGNNVWIVNDFFLNGQKQMNGTYKSKKLKKKHGKFIYYFENGQKMAESSYLEDKPVGKWVHWYKTGEIHHSQEYDNNGKKTGIWQGWHVDGKLDFEGQYVNNEKEGEWKWYFDNGQMSSKEQYEQGKLIKVNFWNEDGSKVEGELKVEQYPSFIGGEDAMQRYIYVNIKYPPLAIKQNIQGKAFISFIVEKDGSISNVEVLRGIGSECDKEAVRVIKNMPKWNPGKLHNRPVRVKYTIPIVFRLSEK